MSSQELFPLTPLKEKSKLGYTLNKAEERRKLLEEIEHWKSLRDEINHSLKYYKILSPISGNYIINDNQNSLQSLEKIPDAIELWKEELCRFAGIYCTKFDQDKEFIFKFNSAKKNFEKETYFVQILVEKQKGKLGFWKMPLLLDVNVILSRCPIDDLRNIKNFMRLCQYYLLCQQNRKMQFEALKAYVGQLSKCSVQANHEIYTYIELQIFKLRDLETDQFYDIVLYIGYELLKSRPNTLVTDSFYREPLPEDVIVKLKKIFKNFKLLELKPAFEKIVDEENGKFFYWEKHSKAAENDDLESNSGSREEGNKQTEVKPVNEEGKENQKSIQQSKTNSETSNKNKNLNKQVVTRKRKFEKSDCEETTSSPGMKSDEDSNEKSKFKNIKKSSAKRKINLTKVAPTDSLQNRTLRFEADEKLENIHGKKDQTGSVIEGEIINIKEENKNRQITRKSQRKKKIDVIKKSTRLKKQSMLDVSKQTFNYEPTENSDCQARRSNDQEKNEQDKDEEKLQIVHNNRVKRFRSETKNKTQEVGREIIINKEDSQENQNLAKEFEKHKKNSQIEDKEKSGITGEKKHKKSISSKREDTIEGHLQSEIIETGKKDNIKVKSMNKPLKKTFDLSNFVLKKGTEKNDLVAGTISLTKNIACSSTPIPNRKQRHFQLDNEISEVIKSNEQIKKPLEKRSKNNSTDSDYEDIVEDANESLLKNLEEIKKKVSSARNNYNQKNKKLKKVKKSNKIVKKF